MNTVTPFARLEVFGLSKSASTRRAFLQLLLRNTTGGAAIGAAYKGGLRPAIKNLQHEVGPAAVGGTTAGPASKPAVSPGDLKAWLDARETATKRMSGAGQWGGDYPAKQIEGAANREAFGALSGPGQNQAMSRFGKLQAAEGAAQGGLLGLGATSIKATIEALLRAGNSGA